MYSHHYHPLSSSYCHLCQSGQDSSTSSVCHVRAGGCCLGDLHVSVSGALHIVYFDGKPLQYQ